MVNLRSRPSKASWYAGPSSQRKFNLVFSFAKEIVNSKSNVKFCELLRKYRILVVTFITHIGLIMNQIQDGLIEGLKGEIRRLMDMTITH